MMRFARRFPSSRAATVIASCLTIATLWATSAAAHTPDSCGTGTLTDVEVVTTIVATESRTIVRTRRDRRGRREEWVERTPSERRERRYLVTIELDDLRYTGESSADAPWDFDPRRLVINDTVDVCVDGSRIVVTRPNGKHYRATIVRAVRPGR